jgi:hypothetical protein
MHPIEALRSRARPRGLIGPAVALLTLGSCGFTGGVDHADGARATAPGQVTRTDSRSAGDLERVKCRNGEALGQESGLIDPAAFDRVGHATAAEAAKERIEQASKARKNTWAKRLADPKLRYERRSGDGPGHATFLGRRRDGTAAVAIFVVQGGTSRTWLVNGLDMCQPPSKRTSKKRADPIVGPKCNVGSAERIGPGTATDSCEKEDTSE